MSASGPCQRANGDDHASRTGTWRREGDAHRRSSSSGGGVGGAKRPLVGLAHRVRDLVHGDEPVGESTTRRPCRSRKERISSSSRSAPERRTSRATGRLPRGVAHSDHGCLCHIGVIGKVVLQLEAADPLPARLDHVFDPIDDPNVSPLVVAMSRAASHRGTVPRWTGRRVGSKRRPPTARASNSPSLTTCRSAAGSHRRRPPAVRPRQRPRRVGRAAAAAPHRPSPRRPSAPSTWSLPGTSRSSPRPGRSAPRLEAGEEVLGDGGTAADDPLQPA